MKIVEEAVEVFTERMFCDCGTEMKPTGECLLSKPPLYPHHCSGCGHSESVRGYCYPRTIHKMKIQTNKKGDP